MFKYADEGTYISLRAFDQFNSRIPPTLIRAVRVNGDLSRIAAQAAQAEDALANADRPSVFCPPIATFSNGLHARTADLANGLSLSVEIDDGDTSAARIRLEHLIGPATVVVESGGEWAHPDTGETFPKLHIHWRLSEPTRIPDDHAKLRDARDFAARLVGADPTGKPIVHPLRWPGSWNRKSKPRIARIVHYNDEAEINLDEALEAVTDAIEAAGLASIGLPVPSTPKAAYPLVAAAMDAIPNPGTAVHYDTWIRYGYATCRATGGEGFPIWEAWSKKSDKYQAAETEAAWHRISHSVAGKKPPRTIGAGTIFFGAANHGWTRPSDPPPEEPDDPGYWQSARFDHEQNESDNPDSAENPPLPGDTLRVYDPWNTLRPVRFPAEAIPHNLRVFVEERTAILGADPCAIAWACLCAASAAIDGRIRLQMKRRDTWTVPPAIWLALIGAPSTKKTPIIETAWHPLHRAQARDFAEHTHQLTQWKTLPKEDRTKIPEPELQRRLVSHDATMEALQGILAKQDRGIGVLRDELAGWIGSLEKYAPGKGGAADRAFALQSYNGSPHVVDRVMRGTLSINNLLCVICGGIQPDRLRQFGDLTDDGLWQRFIPIIVAPGTIGADANPADDWHEQTVNRLLRIPAHTTVSLCEAAHTIRERVAIRAFDLEQSGVLGPRFVGFCGKLTGLWGRITLVLHLMTEPESQVVREETAESARILVFRSVLPNAARVYTAMGGAGADLEATQSIAGYILTKKLRRIIASDLTSNVRVCRHRSIEDVRKLLSPLEAGGWIRPEKEFNPTSWLVTDHVHTQFAAQAEKETARRAAVRRLITGEDG